MRKKWPIYDCFFVGIFVSFSFALALSFARGVPIVLVGAVGFCFNAWCNGKWLDNVVENVKGYAFTWFAHVCMETVWELLLVYWMRTAGGIFDPGFPALFCVCKVAGFEFL